ncbi:MAG: ATP-dependent 6-phosphofructokinase [Elusimicrobiota bacterium]
MTVKRIGVLTAGGDCPGLNAVLRAVVKSAVTEHGIEIIGFYDGYEGLVTNKYKHLSFNDVSGIITKGGTVLGTSNTANPYRFPYKKKGKLIIEDRSKEAIKNYKELGLEALVCIGGDGSQSIAYKLYKDGINVIGVPKTIDNDLIGTDRTFGFDTAVSIVTEAIDRLHTTAESHHRVIIVEVMGRYAGWIALHSGIAGGGDIILLPEMPYEITKILQVLKDRQNKGRLFTIIVISEGAKPKGGRFSVQKIINESTDPVRLGGAGMKLADDLEKLTAKECRVVVLGHLQRGGTPTAYDRILASEFGYEAINMAVKKKFGCMVGSRGGKLVYVSLEKIAGKTKNVSKNHELVRTAKAFGVSFGV